uniref:Elongation of very long chain fatty acids protein n=1 Tax=Brachionus koreanus TaxID=1199090 RepID=A0A291LM91_9BILA|nr:elongase 6 [Brachionus koreanus]QBO55910.1 elongation of very long chain fatty acid 3/6c [Brachionus koreanus]
MDSVFGENFNREKFNEYLNEFNYSFLFEFERKYLDYDYVIPKRQWIAQNWHWSIIISIIYIIAVFAGQRIMENYRKFDLKRCLVAWNFILAAFSFLGSIRFLPHFFFVLENKGIDGSICIQDFAQGVPGCWTYLFIMSKVAELVDTLFIILRKQNLLFLHWYHHATVLIYCWFASKDLSSSGRWFTIMNYIVHSFMYGYYAFRALRFKIPKWINIAITSGQISQMVVGLYVNTIAYKKKINGEECHVSYDSIYWSFFMYFTYFVLFFNFFMNAYLKKQPIVKKISLKRD